MDWSIGRLVDWLIGRLVDDDDDGDYDRHHDDDNDGDGDGGRDAAGDDRDAPDRGCHHDYGHDS